MSGGHVFAPLRIICQLLSDKLWNLKLLIITQLRDLIQNITFGAPLPHNRKAPVFKDVMVSAGKGEGGPCFWLNNFMKLQLQCLGFDANLVSGSFRRAKTPDLHVVIKVNIPARALKYPHENTINKSFIVDLACGVPLHEAVCIDDLALSPFRRKAGGLDYQYEKINDVTIQRVNECGDAIIGKRKSTYISPQDCTINLKHKTFADMIGPTHAAFNDPASNPLHQAMYLFRYLEITNDDFKCVCIRGTELIYITKHKRETQKFNSYHELKPYVLELFPMIHVSLVEQAVESFSIPFEEATKMYANARNI